MCGDGKQAYRDCVEPVMPRTAEEIYEAAKRKQQARCKKPHATGTDWESDYLR